MKKWIMFIVIPILVMWFLEFISAVILGGMFQFESGGFVFGIASLFIYFLGGTTMYLLSPLPDDTFSPRFKGLSDIIPNLSDKILITSAYALAYIALGVFLAIITDGTVSVIAGEEVLHETSIITEIVKAAGLLLAIGGAYQNEIDELEEATAE